MERAPLPPHERPWRHPSELAAETRAAIAAEPASASVRTVALLGGATGVLLIGLVVLTMTPRGGDSPTAVSATSTPLLSVAQVALTSPSAFDRGDDESITTPIATPIGRDGLAVVSTQAALEALATSSATVDEEIVVSLSPGRTATAAFVHLDSDDELALVEITDRAVSITGMDVATRLPHAREMVTVLTDPPVEVEFELVDELDVADGTAVVDRSGALVGLCVEDDATAEGVAFSALADAPVGADAQQD